MALENIFVDLSFSNKEQAIQFLCGHLGVNGRTEHPCELEEDVWQREVGEVELVIMLTLGANDGMNHVKVFSQLERKQLNKNFRQSQFAAQDAQSILTLLETELTF